MWWTSRSENALTAAFPRDDVMLEGCVELIVGVWHAPQPMFTNAFRPLTIEFAPPGVVVDGVGGARSRMNVENCTASLGMDALTTAGLELLVVGVKCVGSSG